MLIIRQLRYPSIVLDNLSLVQLHVGLILTEGKLCLVLLMSDHILSGGGQRVELVLGWSLLLGNVLGVEAG